MFPFFIRILNKNKDYNLNLKKDNAIQYYLAYSHLKFFQYYLLKNFTILIVKFFILPYKNLNTMIKITNTDFDFL